MLIEMVGDMKSKGKFKKKKGKGDVVEERDGIFNILEPEDDIDESPSKNTN